jgi:2-polyprenyl-6-methoxyphenol hydroxylase-like FAD-dependent oxidoreductase
MHMGKTLQTNCCIAGGGPAGMVLGFLLARSGVDVYVLEKHADFLRDFRGDTIHPSTLEIMYELGILDEFLKRPHQEIRELSAQIGAKTFTVGDFTHLPTHTKFLALMPQWDFLDFIKDQAAKYSTFHLMMQAEVTGLIEENGKVSGARANTTDGPVEIRAALTVGADGRRSTVRSQSRLEVENLGAPMDVMWMRISRRPTDPPQTFGHLEPGKILFMINRDEYWQCAYVIPKGTADEVRQKGLPSFREEIAKLSPFLDDRVDELHDWKDVSVLSVAVDRLKEWSRPGLLCIGDAAHAMSPIGGVGINLAIQDAVAAANILAPRLRQRDLNQRDLQAVQERRMFPTRVIQGAQILIQNNVIQRVLTGNKPLKPPFVIKLLSRFPMLRRLPARMVGLGVRPEHIKTAEAMPVR